MKINSFITQGRKERHFYPLSANGFHREVNLSYLERKAARGCIILPMEG